MLTATIPVIQPGESVTASLPFQGQPLFARPLRMKVDVAPVPHEATLSDNTREYAVEFQV